MALHPAPPRQRHRIGIAGSRRRLVTTHSYFATLGVGFARGRRYTADEDRPEGARVVVLSHRLWTRRYGARRRADRAAGPHRRRARAGRRHRAGAGWIGTGSPDVWMPARFNAANPPIGNFGWNAIGRLKPGVRPEQAATHLEPLVKRAMSEYIQSDNYRAFLTDGRYRPIVHDMKEDIIGGVREPLWILLGTVAMVLLVACGNVANLCLVRAESRQREIAVRVALGGSRAGLIRKLLAEALRAVGDRHVLGVAVAAAALPMLLRLAPQTIPRLELVRVDGTVLLFAAAAAVSVGAALRADAGDSLHAAERARVRCATAGAAPPIIRRGSGAASCSSSRRPRWRWCCSSARACWRAASRG